MSKKDHHTRLLPLGKSIVPEIGDYPFPRIAKGRRIASIVYQGRALSSQVFLSGNRAYKREDYTSYRDALKWLLKEKMGAEWDTHRYTFGLRVRFFLQDRRKMDLDNLLKPIMDAGTGQVWADDSQVVEIYAIMLRDDPEPRVEFLVYSMDDYNDYHHACIVCGKDINGREGFRNRPYAQFCSKTCCDNAQRKGSELTCKNCGKKFWDGRSIENGERRRKRAKIFCSRPCWDAWQKSHGEEQVQNIRGKAKAKEFHDAFLGPTDTIIEITEGE
jgi:Holliday junction resolvase RusA-like endonuclease